MKLSQLDAADLFSLTTWRSADGHTAGVQKRAGDPVKYATRKTLSAAIVAALESIEPETPSLAAPPY